VHSTTPPAYGIQPPSMPVPAPRGVIGMRRCAHSRTTAATSATLRGLTSSSTGAGLWNDLHHSARAAQKKKEGVEGRQDVRAVTERSGRGRGLALVPASRLQQRFSTLDPMRVSLPQHTRRAGVWRHTRTQLEYERFVHLAVHGDGGPGETETSD
jgi:hypothetical protein